MDASANAPQVTNAAFSRIGEIIAAEGADKALRVSVLGGGCSGFQYKFELETPDARAEDDVALEQDGVTVLIDAVSLPFLSGAVIDFKRELIGSRFAVENPNASSTCGCGTSFSV
ncbi:MAG: iron-sulfur cluster insertion protein ErpA [Rhodobacteraceae bacterium]|nr:iron-sulfur cluster insertion protein ErpA [Paracoccaceae bacterium]